MKRFHDEDMQRAWDEAIAAEREPDNDPQRKHRERERLIKWASDHELSPASDDKQVCRGGFLGLVGIKRKHYFSQDYGGSERCWRWRCDAEWNWPNDRAR